jgi:dGTP triphosphohydrolase
MNDNINEIKNEAVESTLVSEPELSNVEKLQLMIKKINLKTAIIIAVVVVISLSGYYYRGLFVAATVNGSPISRFAVIDKLEKTSGSQALDALITEKLIMAEMDRNNITVTDDQVDADIKKIEDQITAQGGTLSQALIAQGMTTADLRAQLTINDRLEKFLADKIQVGGEEISQYIADNKVVIPNGQEAQFNEQISSQLRSNKLNEAAQTLIDSLRSKASINYFVNY